MSDLAGAVLAGAARKRRSGHGCGRCGQTALAKAFDGDVARRASSRAEALRGRSARARGGLVAPAATPRRGAARDAALIARRVLRESMNPLFLDPSNFEVACLRGSEVVAFGQLRPLRLSPATTLRPPPRRPPPSSPPSWSRRRSAADGASAPRSCCGCWSATARCSAEPVWLLTLASRRKFYAPPRLLGAVGGFGVPTGLAAEAAVGLDRRAAGGAAGAHLHAAGGRGGGVVVVQIMSVRVLRVCRGSPSRLGLSLRKSRLRSSRSFALSSSVWHRAGAALAPERCSATRRRCCAARGGSARFAAPASPPAAPLSLRRRRLLRRSGAAAGRPSTAPAARARAGAARRRPRGGGACACSACRRDGPASPPRRRRARAKRRPDSAAATARGGAAPRRRARRRRRRGGSAVEHLKRTSTAATRRTAQTLVSSKWSHAAELLVLDDRDKRARRSDGRRTRAPLQRDARDALASSRRSSSCPSAASSRPCSRRTRRVPCEPPASRASTGPRALPSSAAAARRVGAPLARALRGASTPGARTSPTSSASPPLRRVPQNA